MNKMDKLVVAVALIASAILLALWFLLGFDRVDAPLDLAISVCWWLIALGAVGGIVRAENRRRERLRTVFVAANAVFSPAAGLAERARGVEGAVEAAVGVLDDIRYGRRFQKLPPEGDRPRFTHIVRTFSYDGADGAWSGEVVYAERPFLEPRPFADRSELALALSR